MNRIMKKTINIYWNDDYLIKNNGFLIKHKKNNGMMSILKERVCYLLFYFALRLFCEKIVCFERVGKESGLVWY